MVIENLTVSRLKKAIENLPDNALVMLRDPHRNTDFYVVSARPIAYEHDGAEALILVADHPMIDVLSGTEIEAPTEE